MAATMRLSDRGPDDAINRRISLLVLNKQAEQAILHENAESQNEPVSVLQQPAAAAGKRTHIAKSGTEVIA